MGDVNALFIYVAAVVISSSSTLIYRPSLGATTLWPGTRLWPRPLLL